MTTGEKLALFRKKKGITQERLSELRGRADPENSIHIKEDMMVAYPVLKQKYQNETEIFLAIFKLFINNISIS